MILINRCGLISLCVFLNYRFTSWALFFQNALTFPFNIACIMVNNDASIKAKIFLGGTIKNHLKEWLKNQK